MKPTKWTNETVLEFLRKRTEELKRPLLWSDVSQVVYRQARKLFGSWEKALSQAMENYKVLRPKETGDWIKILKEARDKHDRLPRWEDFPKKRGQDISKHFGSFDVALEQTFGSSHRTIILTALDNLTPASCPTASTFEIAHRLQETGYKCDNMIVSSRLKYYYKAGLVTGHKEGRTVLWKLTPEGKQFLKEFPEQKK